MGFTDMKKLKVNFKNCPIPNRKEIFKHSNCILPISIGQKVHEGEKLLGTLQLINSSFKSCTLMIDDSIQCHTMKITENLSETKLRLKAIEEGDKWLESNKYIYQQLTIPYSITRWEAWRQHDNFKKWFKIIEDLYQSNIRYRESFRQAIQIFLSRYLNRVPSVSTSYEIASNYCLDYLKEECAVMCLWAESGYDFEIYPTGRNQAMCATHNLIINPIFTNRLISVSLYFRKQFISAANSKGIAYNIERVPS